MAQEEEKRANDPATVAHAASVVSQGCSLLLLLLLLLLFLLLLLLLSLSLSLFAFSKDNTLIFLVFALLAKAPPCKGELQRPW